MRLLIDLVGPSSSFLFMAIIAFCGGMRSGHGEGAVEHAMVIEDGDVLELDKDDARKRTR